MNSNDNAAPCVSAATFQMVLDELNDWARAYRAAEEMIERFSGLFVTGKADLASAAKVDPDIVTAICAVGLGGFPVADVLAKCTRIGIGDHGRERIAALGRIAGRASEETGDADA